ncbi:Long-chain-fatty-acid--CoA ligase [Actinokineospora spheciospongiae]|uniref:Long-chain-fatty-acid--CoA ligase n=1 Tax=Actinokineospora spheciospongiae TaxID=909613 RepID=W7J4P4_9PSEU|nr:class I adenylate-forming enzyme family protein [Actinokineospora spheciospongiae]EWC64007.1 Long-chain-fatty-acid--CoA ligase [Actinokineospora spheciospongiae]PWW59610.1 acyl-CoA synthetase (AMP-forming)/AMP-acid ligase II [Actinokineospora spheciospongiae]
MTGAVFGAESAQTWPEVERQALRVVAVLRERGLAPGDRVVFKAGNSAAWVTVLLALMHAEASVLLVDHREQAAETRRMAQRAGARLVVADYDAPLLPDEDPLFLYDLIVDAIGREPVAADLDVTGWAARPDGLIMWTSGSTGTPKGVVKSGGAFLRNLERNADQVGHTATDVLLPLLPFPHQYGLSMVLIAWLRRCSLVVAPYTRLDRALVQAAGTGVTVVDATPSTYLSMLNIIGKRPALAGGLASARMLCAGAAPLDSGLVHRYVERFGLPLLDSYGSTEYANISFATPDNPVACGRAMPGIALRVVDEDGVPVAARQVGEIEVDTPDGLTGHLGEDGSTVPAPTGWVRTGDLGYLDERDNLVVLGRKFAVTRMGYTLYPEIIERRVADAGCAVKVVPLPDERRGAQLVFVVEDPDGHDEAHWRSFLAEVLPTFEQPNRVVVVERFPLNRNGKPDRARLEVVAADTAAEPVLA